MSPGLTLTQQPPISPDITITADDTTHRLWRQIAMSPEFHSALIESVGQLVAGLDTRYARERVLNHLGVTALDGLYAPALLLLGDDTTSKARLDALRLTTQFGAQGRTSTMHHASLDDLASGPLPVLRHAGRDLSIVVRLNEEFDDLQAKQRREVCKLLSLLADACNVSVATTGLRERQFVRRYHEYLPVSAPVTAHRDAQSVSARVEDAHDALDPDSRKVSILRQLRDEPTETLTYNALYGIHHEIENTSVRHALTEGEHSLAELGLVHPFDRPVGHGSAVELLEAGHQYLSELDESVGEQIEIDDAVSRTPDDPPNPSDEYVCTPEPPARETTPQDDLGGGGGGWQSLSYLSWHEHEAVAAAVAGADVGVCDHPIDGVGLTPVFSYDDDRDEVVVGGEFRGAVPMAVSFVRSLAGRQMWDQVLTAERLDAGGDLEAVFDGDRELTTRGGQLGWLSEEETGAAEYIGRLESVRDAICDATTEYRRLRRRDEDDEADDLAKWILRKAQGLIGTITRLLDCCGVDVVWYVQVPEYAADFHTSEDHRRRRSLLRTIAKASTISGAYGAYNAERTMYEPRQRKREFSLGAPQTTRDESGDLLGSWCIAGRGVSKLLDPKEGPSIRSALEHPGSLQEEQENYAPFDIDVAIRTDRHRRSTRAAVRRMCRAKNMAPTKMANALFQACCGSVFDITRALNHLGAEPEEKVRPIRADEVRRALATVPGNRLLADIPSRSAGPLLKTMLITTTTQSQSELANRTDVTTATVRNNASILEALSLIESESGGPGMSTEWRCTLPHREERDERGATTGLHDPGAFDRATRDLTEAVAPTDVIEAFGREIRDLNTLVERCPVLRPWLRIATAACGRDDLDPDEYGDVLLGRSQSAGLGEPPDQTSLAAGASAGVGD